jgi:uncharacterized protein YjiS (DUF1127 family)
MLKAIIVAYKRHSIYTRTLKELERLSDKELYDLGLDRSKITSLAYEVTYGKELKSDFKPFWNFFKVKTEKNKIEEYLADSANLVDLENRIKAMDRGLAPWQVNGKIYTQGFML